MPTPPSGIREIHPIYPFIAVGRENELISQDDPYEMIELTDDWIAVVSYGCSAGQGVRKRFHEKPSMSQAEELFFSSECEWLRDYWHKEAYVSQDSTLIVAIKNQHRAADFGQPLQLRETEPSSMGSACRALTPLMTDDVRSRVLFVFGRSLFNTLQECSWSFARLGEGMDGASADAMELCLRSMQGLLTAVVAADSEDACAYASRFSTQLDEQLSGFDLSSELGRRAMEFWNRAVPVIRPELRTHTDVTVECFAMRAKSNGVKAHASFSALAASLDALIQFFVQSRAKKRGLSKVDTAKLAAAFHAVGCFVAVTNETLVKAEGDAEVGRMLFKLRSTFVQGGAAAYHGWSGHHPIVVRIYEAYCEALGAAAYPALQTVVFAGEDLGTQREEGDANDCDDSVPF